MNRHIQLLSLAFLIVLGSSDAFAQRGRGQQRRGSAQSGQNNGNQQSMRQGQFRGGQSQNGGSGQKAGAANSLSANETQGLILMREEEKLARDVYLAMQTKWGDQVFANISQAESRHMNAVGNLLKRYQIQDPITNNAQGAFNSAKFQQLYQTLIASGSNSHQDALKVGLKIEEMDIADLKVAIAATNNQDINRVLENLLRGSRNHLRAFASRLNAVDGTYVATSLNQAEFDKIASSNQESGQGNGRSAGKGNGRMNGQGNGGGQSMQRGQGKGKDKRRGNRGS